MNVEITEAPPNEKWPGLEPKAIAFQLAVVLAGSIVFVAALLATKP